MLSMTMFECIIVLSLTFVNDKFYNFMIFCFRQFLLSIIFVKIKQRLCTEETACQGLSRP